VPLTAKGREVMASMMKTYKKRKKARSVFYAMVNAGKLKGVEGKR
jgi:hypothetical protein